MIAQSEDNVNTFWLCYGSYTGKKDIRLFIKYVQASCYVKNNPEEKAFRVYVASTVQNINRILAENFGGAYMKISYQEMLKPKREETRTAEEIINDIKNGLKRLN